jgi:hypothetical protein
LDLGKCFPVSLRFMFNTLQHPLQIDGGESGIGGSGAT